MKISPEKSQITKVKKHKKMQKNAFEINKQTEDLNQKLQ